MKRKPGEKIRELAAIIVHDATTCDFTSIHDPQGEALRTISICSAGNEATLSAFFKLNDEDLTFTQAIKVAVEIEETGKVAIKQFIDHPLLFTNYIVKRQLL